jgi:hypothetical protein
VIFTAGYGAFVARAALTPARARALAGAGHRLVVIQVDYQGSLLAQRTALQLRAEVATATEAGLGVWWWAWCRPGDRRGAGRRPGGPEALRRRLEELREEVGAPTGVLANCEVGGGWDPLAPALDRMADAARAAGMPLVGLSSHGIVGPRWPTEAFDLGLPQLYRERHITRAWARYCLASWARVPEVWPTLGCADEASDAAAMRADLAAILGLGARGALWWTARQLTGPKLTASTLTGPSTP